MELIPYLSAVIFIATIATVVLATLSYMAFKLRGRRRPRATAERPVYFRRFEPPALAPEGGPDATPAASGTRDGKVAP
jgi:hypothetical protein